MAEPDDAVPGHHGRRAWRRLAVLAALALLAAGCPEQEAEEEPEPEEQVEPEAGIEEGFRRIEEVTTSQDLEAEDSSEQWAELVPEAELVSIPSTADDHEQPAMWLPPAGEGGQPLLVVLHSWSFGHEQNYGIPYARWALDHGWGMIHPHFRGEFDRPEANGSDLVVQDVLDAVDFAIAEADIDPERVHLLGHSGGGSVALLMAGRHPERFAAAVAWVPILDLTDWYAFTSEQHPEDRYADDIAAACGGDPTQDQKARAECDHRSALTHLDGARQAGVPIYIGHGLHDDLVLPDRPLEAFNLLADDDDRIPDEVLEAAQGMELPEDVRGSVEAETWFRDDDPEVHLARESRGSTIVLFEGGHDMVFNPGLEWLFTSVPEIEVEPTEARVEEEPEEVAFTRLEGIATGADQAGPGDTGLERWRQEVPRIEHLEVPSTLDGETQRVLWLPPGGDDPSPLLVVLHSWSVTYDQHRSIPYARWAEANGWAMVAPDFRGVFDGPEAAGSEEAVQDVIDAIDHVGGLGPIDGDRVFTIGFSGGGMMSLLMAGHHPDRFAGAVSFVPVHDMTHFYEHSHAVRPNANYIWQIEAICGGDPTVDEAARDECLRRSPVSHLDVAREAGVPIYLGHGMRDDLVPPSAALEVFDALADPEDRVGDAAIEAAEGNRLPEALRGEVSAETWFRDPDPDVVFARSSGPVTLVLYEAQHDMVYHPGLEWMVRGEPARH